MRYPSTIDQRGELKPANDVPIAIFEQSVVMFPTRILFNGNSVPPERAHYMNRKRVSILSYMKSTLSDMFKYSQKSIFISVINVDETVPDGLLRRYRYLSQYVLFSSATRLPANGSAFSSTRIRIQFSQEESIEVFVNRIVD